MYHSGEDLSGYLRSFTIADYSVNANIHQGFRLVKEIKKIMSWVLTCCRLQ